MHFSLNQVDTENKSSPQSLRRFGCSVAMALMLILLAGCETYGQKIREVPDLIERNQNEAAVQAVNNTHNCDGKDRLLCEMMFAMIEHRFRNYEASAHHLQLADQMAEELYTYRLREWLIKSITNPDMAPYRGTEYEWVYLSYLNAINYVNLARTATDEGQRREHLSAARVEIRRVDIKLRDIETRKGTYEEVADKKREFVHQVLRIFKILLGGLIDSQDLQFREDGYLRYFTGLVYEMLGEWDDARIAYQKAANLYDQGYIKQYGLGEGMGKQAWFDTIRMMQKAGYPKGKRSRLARQKLDAKQRELLKTYGNDVAQLIVFEHFDRVPETGELNMFLKVNRPMKALVLSPAPLRNPGDRQAQLAWFRMVYSDKGILQLIHKYNHGGLMKVAASPFEKTIPLGPLWDVFERNSMIKAIEKFPLRIAVPYMRPLPSNIGRSSLTVNGRPMSSLHSADSLAQFAMQARLRSAGLEILAAVARSLIQLKTAVDRLDTVGMGNMGGFLPYIMSAAETRSWLLLPYAVRMTRVTLKPGRHEAELIVRDANGGELDRERRTLEIKAGQIAVWTTFTSGKKDSSTTPLKARLPTIPRMPSGTPSKEQQAPPVGAIFKRLKKVLDEIEKERQR